MPAISATIITRNEERNIEDALRSLAWADETVVVDCGSTDRTVEICRRYTDRVFHRGWSGFVDQKNYALDRARNDWVISLDADERLSSELTLEVRELSRHGFAHAGYRIPRVACLLNRWIRHGEWYPDRQLRLFDRRAGRWQGGRVHESVAVQGSIGALRGEIHHYTYRRISDYLERLETYTTLAAQDYFERGKKSSYARLLFNPFFTFLKGYVLKRGFLDGVPGLMVAAMGAVSVYFKYAKLYELQHKR